MEKTEAGLPHRIIDPLGDLRHVLIVSRDVERFADRPGCVQADARVGPVGSSERLLSVPPAAHRRNKRPVLRLRWREHHRLRSDFDELGGHDAPVILPTRCRATRSGSDSTVTDPIRAPRLMCSRCPPYPPCPPWSNSSPRLFSAFSAPLRCKALFLTHGQKRTGPIRGRLGRISWWSKSQS